MADQKVEVTVELTAPWRARPVTQQDISWDELLKIAQQTHRMLDECQRRLQKARAQKNEWKRKYELLLGEKK